MSRVTSSLPPSGCGLPCCWSLGRGTFVLDPGIAVLAPREGRVEEFCRPALKGRHGPRGGLQAVLTVRRLPLRPRPGLWLWPRPVGVVAHGRCGGGGEWRMTGRWGGSVGRVVVGGDRAGTRESPDPRDPGFRTAVLTGFEPAASTLTGWRALQTAPQDQVFAAALRLAAKTDCTAGRRVRSTSLLVITSSPLRPPGPDQGPRRLRGPRRRSPSRSACRRRGRPSPGRARSS